MEATKFVSISKKYPSEWVEWLRKNDLAFFAEDMLNMEVADVHKRWSQLVTINEKLCIQAPRDHGKTQSNKFTEILLDDGRVVKYSQVKAGDRVLSIGEDKKIHSRMVEHVQNCGIKKIVKITTQSGRETYPALTHPFLKFDGWTKTEELKVGDRIAVPRSIEINLPEYDVSDDEVMLLGHFIANGCGINNTIQSEKYFEEIIDLADRLKARSGDRIRKGLIGFNSSYMHSFLQKYNLVGKLSVEKEIPDQVYKFSKRQLGLFISKLWADGHISLIERKDHRRQVNIDLCMASEKIVKQIHHLLLRLGVVSHFSEKKVKYIKKDGQAARAWRVSITGKDNQSKFLEAFDGYEEEKNFLKTIKSNSQNDQIPEGWKALLKQTPHWHRENGIRIDNDYEISREKLLRVALAEDNEALLQMANSDVLWDRIVSIEDMGEDECWDLQVEGDHNYIANDIFSHNSFFFSFAYAIWRAYYNWIPSRIKDSKDFKSIPRVSIGYIFSNTQDQAIKLLDLVKREIEENPKLWHLIPEKKDVWSKTEIKLSNGAVIRARGWGVSVRGAHPCLTFDTPITTEHGSIPIGELVGKRVRVLTGKGTWKEAEFWHSGVKKVGTLSLGSKYTRDKTKITLTKNHKILTETGWEESHRASSLKIISQSFDERFQMIGWLWNDGGFKRGVPLLFGPEQELAWLRGMFSANGCVIGNVQIKLASKSLVLYIESILNKYGVNTCPIQEMTDKKGFKSYSLAIHKKSTRQFLNTVGFIQKYKNDKAKDLAFEIYKFQELKEEVDVFDFRVIDAEDETEMSALSDGVVVHNCWIIADDCLNDESIYSELTRKKQIDYFFSAVTPMLVPFGQLVVVGCVTPDTFVLTKDGVCKIGDLINNERLSEQRVIDFNQEVYGENGFKVAEKYWVNGKCKTKRITTTYGLTIEGSHRHPIRVQKGRSPSQRKLTDWCRMDELKLKQLVQVEIGQNVYGNGFNDVELAYFMGLWTAEGSSEHQNKSRVQSIELYQKMQAQGVVFAKAEHKVIPKVIFSATKEAQQAFLRGFADGDGSSYLNDKLQQINLCSVSKELIVGIRAILMNMGIMPSYSVRPPAITERAKGKFESHNLIISSGYAYKFMNEIGFTVKHKIKPFIEKEAPSKFFVGIKKIEDGETETVDFVIPNDHTFCSNGFISHNTPFHQEDLYDKLRKNVSYTFHTFPAINQKGEALWPTRYTKEALMKRKDEVGSTRFSREYLCNAVSDDASLFPDYIIERCFADIEMLPYITADEYKEIDVFMGVDLALSSTVGADYTVITTVGRRRKDGLKFLLDITRFKGQSMRDQLRTIQDVAKSFKPLKIYVENNGFQRVFVDELVRDSGLPVEGFTTTAHAKNDASRGVLQLQVLFESGHFIIPRKTERCREKTDPLINELRAFSYVDGKLQGLGAHDDCVMSLWIAIECMNSGRFEYSYA